MASFKANMMINLFKRMNVNQWDIETYVKRMKIGPSMKPPQRMKKKYRIQEVYKDCFEVIPKTIKSQTIMIYFHGGAYVGGLTKAHWKFACKLASSNQCKVLVIDYLLTPTFHYNDTIKHALNNYNLIHDSHPDSEIILIGDSAGGGLAIALSKALYLEDLKKPKAVIALCPWLDLTKSYSSESNDLILNTAFLKHYALLYSNNETSNPLVSPIMVDSQKLPPVHLLTCTGDLLNKEAKIFKDKANRLGVEIDYYEQEGMFHTYFLFSLKESEPVLEWINKAV